MDADPLQRDNMNKEIKRELLRRKFSSIEYMEELVRFFTLSLEGLKESIDWFYNHPPDVDWQSWNIADRPDGWEKTAVPNFESYLESIRQGIENYKNGDPNRIRGTSHCIKSITRDLDNLGEKWWDYVNLETGRRFGVNLGKAKKIAANICWTLAEYWEDDEILDEEVTGPIDEKDLLRYLKPGEEA
jgi:hypothetical protein